VHAPTRSPATCLLKSLAAPTSQKLNPSRNRCCPCFHLNFALLPTAHWVADVQPLATRSVHLLLVKNSSFAHDKARVSTRADLLLVPSSGAGAPSFPFFGKGGVVDFPLGYSGRRVPIHRTGMSGISPAWGSHDTALDFSSERSEAEISVSRGSETARNSQPERSEASLLCRPPTS
jgi:hypothetical protein